MAELSPSASTVRDLYRELPLSFEPNQGQSDSSVQFLSRGPGCSVALTGAEIVLGFRMASEGTTAGPIAKDQMASETRADRIATLRMKLIGAEGERTAFGLDQMPGVVNYYVGNNPDQWRRNIPTFAKVEVPAVYPGVDLICYGNNRQLEYDLVIAPGADPDQIVLGLEGADEVSLDANGDLVVCLEHQEVRFRKPVMYQTLDQRRREITGGYRLGREARHASSAAESGNDWRISFDLGEYDRNLPLVIDPIIWHSSYIGGSGLDTIGRVAFDSLGQTYFAGKTTSTDFPGGTVAPGVYAYVAKLSATPTSTSAPTLLMFTLLGGGSSDTTGGPIAVSGSDIFIAGSTRSATFPVTANAFDQTHNGGSDVFCARLNSQGGLLYSSFLGGTGDDTARAIAVSLNNAYVTGGTKSPGFPQKRSSTPIVGSDVSENVFVARFSTVVSGADSLVYSKVAAGPNTGTGFPDEAGTDLAINQNGEVLVLGRTDSPQFPVLNELMTDRPGPDVFLMKINSGLNPDTLISTYFGGNGDDTPGGIAVLGTQVFITGTTTSTDLPVFSFGVVKQTSAFQFDQPGRDAFVVKLDQTTTGKFAIRYSTYLGGSSEDSGTGIAVDANGNASVTGSTSSPNFPLKNPLPSIVGGTFNGGALNGGQDAFVAQLSTFGTSLLFGTYLGGSLIDTGGAIALDASANIHVTGGTASFNFPVANMLRSASGGNLGFQHHGGAAEGFLTKIGPPPTGAGITGAWGELAQACQGVGRNSVCVLGGEFEVQNVRIDPAGNFAIAFFLSEDETVDENDLFLHQVHVGRLGSHESTRRDLHVALPPGVSATGLRVIALVDVDNDVDEPNENNNVIVSNPIE